MASSSMHSVDLTQHTGAANTSNRVRGHQQKVLDFRMGYPNFAISPPHAMDMLNEILRNEASMLHQYTSSLGHPRLTNALAKMFSPLLHQQLSPTDHIFVTSGAIASLYCCMQSVVNPGDEVILIEPAFLCYESMVRRAQGKPVFVSLRPIESEMPCSADWQLDYGELASKFNSNTKLILLNTPHNPTGKVFTDAELKVIADLCIEYDVVCISDEVYQFMIYQGQEHISIATLPGMWERTITIGSAGKLLGLTGWRVGWSIASAPLIKPLQLFHHNYKGSCTTPMQEVIAQCLEIEMDTKTNYFKSVAKELENRGARVAQILTKMGFKVFKPHGSFFFLCDWSNVSLQVSDSNQEEATTTMLPDQKFTKELYLQHKIQVFPGSMHYGQEHKNSSRYVRVCFARSDEVITELEKCIGEW